MKCMLNRDLIVLSVLWTFLIYISIMCWLKFKIAPKVEKIVGEYVKDNYNEIISTSIWYFEPRFFGTLKRDVTICRIDSSGYAQVKDICRDDFNNYFNYGLRHGSKTYLLNIYNENITDEILNQERKKLVDNCFKSKIVRWACYKMIKDKDIELLK